jgi:16S rRNA (uracil1498-N3)-methyltransferase
MIHRFFVGDSDMSIGSSRPDETLKISNVALVNQIGRVLRMRPGEQLVLFDGLGVENLYKISSIEPKVVVLCMLETLAPKLPTVSVYLAWSLLKKDKNDWVLQKCTELCVGRFLPTITERTEKTGFDTERSHKIVVEAAEQCGRHDIPSVQEPSPIQVLVQKYQESTNLFYADMCDSDGLFLPLRNDSGDIRVAQDRSHVGLVLVGQKSTSESPSVESRPRLVFVGPEGGWSQKELAFFVEKNIPSIGLGQFTLRAETACIVAAQRLVNS